AILSSNVSVKHPANEAHQTNASRDFPRKHRIRQIADKPGNSTARSPKSAMKFQNVDRSSTMSLLHRERTAFHNRTHHDATDDNRSLKSSHREAARAVEYMVAAIKDHQWFARVAWKMPSVVHPAAFLKRPLIR